MVNETDHDEGLERFLDTNTHVMAKVYVCVRSKIMITRAFISCDHDGLTTLKTIHLQHFWQLNYILCDLYYNCWPP